eukprot:scpid22568/ scgid4846/ 
MARLAALMRYFIFYVHLSALVTELQAADCKWPLDKLVVDFHFSPTDLSESAAQRPLSLSLTVRGQVYGDVTWASPSRILTDDDIDMLQVTTRPSEPCFKSWLVTIKGGTEVASDPFQHWNVTVYRDSARTVARTFRTSGTMRLFDAVHDLCNSTLPRFRCENKGVCYNADTKPREPAEVKALWGSFPRQNPLVQCSCPPGFHGDRCEIACNQQVQPAQSGVVTITVNTSCPLNYTDPDNLLVAAGATGPSGGQASCPSVAPGGAFQLYMGSVAQSDAGMVTCGGHSYNVIVQYPQSYDLTPFSLACLHNKPQRAPCQLGQCVQVSWTDPHLVTCPLKQSNPPGSLTWTVADPAKGGCFNSTTNLISSNPCNWPRGAYRSYPTAEAIKDACDSSGDPGVCDPDPCLLALNKSSKSTAARNVTSETTGWNDLGVGCQAFSACYRCTLTSMFGSLSYDVTYSRQKNPCSRYTTSTFKFQTGGSTISNASFVRCGIVEGSACPQAPGGVLPAYQVIERANGSLVNLTVSLLVNEMDPQEIGIVWYRTGRHDQYIDTPEFHQPGGSPCYISLTWTFTANNRTAGNYSVQFAHDNYPLVQLRQIMELKVPEHGCSLKTFKFETGGSAISDASFVRCGIVEGSACPQAPGGVLPAYQVIERANGSLVNLTVSLLVNEMDPQEIGIVWYRTGRHDQYIDTPEFHQPGGSPCYISLTWTFTANNRTAGNYSVQFAHDNYPLVQLRQIMELKVPEHGCSLKTFKFETGGSAISDASFVRCGIVEGSDCPQAQGGVLPAYQVIERANGSQSPVELTVSILAAFDDIVILWYLNGVKMPSDPATFFVPKESDGLVRCYIVSTLNFGASDLTAGNYSVRFSRDNSLVNLSQIMELKLTHPGEGPATTAGPPTNSTPQVTPDSNTARVIVIASSAGGGALLFIVVIVSVCVCRRKRAASRGLTITDGGSDYLHKPVTWRQLSHLAEFLSVDWQHFVADLGLEEYQIRTCIGEYPQSINEQARKALRIWFQGISSDASQTWTVSKLMDRLHENNLQSVADNWKMRIGGGKNDQQGSSATRPLGVNADKERSMDDNGSIMQRLLDVDNYDSGNGSPLALSCGSSESDQSLYA